MSPLTELITGAKSYGWSLSSALPSSFESIATVLVGSGGSSSVQFNSIPTSYINLQLRFIARGSRTSPEVNDYLNVRFNSDSGSNYARHRFIGNGSSVSSLGASSINQFYIENVPAAGSIANATAPGVMDILDYSNTNKFKTVKFFVGKDENSASGGSIMLHSASWQSTSAITSITITPGVGPIIEQHSHFALYGIRGA